MEAEVTIMGALHCQVCVPESFSDDDAIEFAESKYPCGSVAKKEKAWCISCCNHNLYHGGRNSLGTYHGK